MTLPPRCLPAIIAVAVCLFASCEEAPTAVAEAEPPPTSLTLDGLRFTASARFEPEFPHRSGEPTPAILGELTVENVTAERVVWSFPMGGCMRGGRLYREGEWREPVYDGTTFGGCLAGEVLVDLEPGESATPEEWFLGFDPPDGIVLEPGTYRVSVILTLGSLTSVAGEILAPEPVQVPAGVFESR